MLPQAKRPTRGTEFSAGWDLYAATGPNFTTNNRIIYDTGIAMEIPEGYVGLVYARSSIHKMAQRLTNGVGVIDSDYRGSIKFVFDYKAMFDSQVYSFATEDMYKVGDRIGQLVVVQHEDLVFIEAEELTDTTRGSGGFGSTGSN